MTENALRIGILICTVMSGLYWLGEPVSRGHYLVAVVAGLVVFSLMFGVFRPGKLVLMLGAMIACVWTMVVEFGG